MVELKIIIIIIIIINKFEKKILAIEKNHKFYLKGLKTIRTLVRRV